MPRKSSKRTKLTKRNRASKRNRVSKRSRTVRRRGRNMSGGYYLNQHDWENYLKFLRLHKTETLISLDNKGITDERIKVLCDLITELNIPVERISLGSNPEITYEGIYYLVKTLKNVKTLKYLYLVGSLDSQNSEENELLVEFLVDLKNTNNKIIIYAYKTHEIEPANVNFGRIVITK